MEEKSGMRQPNNVILENRKLLSVSGVKDVDSFDESLVILLTELGQLTVKGNGLHISKLNVETGELCVDGEIAAVFYSDDAPRKASGWFSRMFR